MVPAGHAAVLLTRWSSAVKIGGPLLLAAILLRTAAAVSQCSSKALRVALHIQTPPPTP